MPAAHKTVFHLDMDAFFVSVEELFDPTLKGKAVVVGGRKNERGVVAAASYEARKFGVHSAMPLRTAARLCPHAIFVDGHPERYRECSETIYSVLQRFSPKVEMVSIDEAYLDMTGTERLLGAPLKAAHLLHQMIKDETSLNCSIGIAASRVVAKICSDQAKPNGIFWAIPGSEERLLAPLDVRKIPGIGKVTEKQLHDLGIRTVAQLAVCDDEILASSFGAWGAAMSGKARGLDAGAWFAEEIGEDSDPKSVSHEHTFGTDTADVDLLESTLARLSEMVARRLRDGGFRARTIQLKLRYSDFHTITRAHTLAQPTQVDGEIFDEIRRLFHRNWDRSQAIRLVGVHASMLERGSDQLEFERPRTRWERAFGAADRLRQKFGETSVFLASTLKGRFGERTHENPAALPGKTKRHTPEQP
jgi:DNA polymerase-4